MPAPLTHTMAWGSSDRYSARENGNRAIAHRGPAGWAGRPPEGCKTQSLITVLAIYFTPKKLLMCACEACVSVFVCVKGVPWHNATWYPSPCPAPGSLATSVSSATVAVCGRFGVSATMPAGRGPETIRRIEKQCAVCLSQQRHCDNSTRLAR